MRRRPLAAALLAAAPIVLLHGCGSTPTAPATPMPGTSAASAPKTTHSLVSERRWLQQWFKDTPVRIAQSSSGEVSIDVPLKYCFDSGQSVVLPPLTAVLDKLAESLRRVPQAQLPLIAASADAQGSRDLGLQRAAAVREQLRSRGIAAARLGEPALATTMAVQLRMSLQAP